jgi:hypothetical protein
MSQEMKMMIKRMMMTLEKMMGSPSGNETRVKVMMNFQGDPILQSKF